MVHFQPCCTLPTLNGTDVTNFIRLKYTRYLGTESAGHTLFLFFASFRRSKSALRHLLCKATCSLRTDKQYQLMNIQKLSQRSNRPFSYSRYRTETSLQVRLMRGSLFKCKLHSTLSNDIPRMSLHCKLVPV